MQRPGLLSVLVLALLFGFFLALVSSSGQKFKTIPLRRSVVHTSSHRPLAQLLRKSDDSHNFPMGGNILPAGIYWTQIALGNPPQYFQLAVDSGSTDLLVPGEGCVGCHIEKTGAFAVNASKTAKGISCDNSPVYCSGCSSSNQCVFMNSYQTCNLTDPTQTCSVAGPMYSDIFGMGDLKARINFGTIMKQTENFQQFFLIDGVIGFAFDGASSWGGESPFKALVEAGQVEDVLAMCLNADNGGIITLGGADPSLYQGEIQYSPLLSEGGWSVYVIQMTDIKVNGDSVGLSPSAYEDVPFGGCVVDSGTNVLLLPNEPFVALQQTLQTQIGCPSTSIPGVCGSDNLFNKKCYAYSKEQLGQFPDIELIINDNISLKMSAHNYLLQNDKGLYCLAVSNTGEGGLLIIGDVVMQNYYAVFDRENKRMGWAPVNSANCQVEQ